MPGVDARPHEPGRTVESDQAVAADAALVQERGNAARAVAALLDLVAVAVEDPVEHGAVGAPGTLQHQRLVKADTGAAIRETAQQRGPEQGLVGGRIEYTAIVADPVHLRESDAHRGAG